MTYAVSSAQMREAERAAIQNYKIPALLLMENAAMRTAQYVEPPCVIFCGTGNNGGDGYALARQLRASGADVSIAAAGEPRTNEARLNYQICRNIGIAVYHYIPGWSCPNPNPLALDTARPCIPEGLLTSAVTLVDALLGIGIRKPVSGVYKEWIDLINTSGKKVVSLDIPSGLDPDTGQPVGGGAAVKATVTVTYGYAKTGLLLSPGASYAGEVIVEGITLPEADLCGFVRVLEEADAQKLMPVRLADSNKGTHGRVLAVAGSNHMPGAAVLASTAAYKIGAGIVEVCSANEVTNVIHLRLPEAVTSSSEALEESLQKASVLLVGPGLGRDAAAVQQVKTVLEKAARPIVLDADGLNAVAEMGVEILKELPAPCVITPHPGEMSRLTGLEVWEILSDPLKTAKDFAATYGVFVLLKGTRTVIAAPDGTAYINVSGSPALAKAGTGDVLAGILAGLIAQGKTVLEAAALGAYLHGKAGERAAAVMPAYAVNAGDVINYV